jgi:hypothetical protein
MLFDVGTWKAEPILIWVDAVCINQVDLEEKSRQSRHDEVDLFMGISVVVWLGDSADSGIAMEVIDDVDITIGTALAGVTRSDYLEKHKDLPKKDTSGYRGKPMLEEVRTSLNGLPGLPSLIREWISGRV